VRRDEYKHVLIRLANSDVARQVRRLDVAPDAVRGLTMLFASRFETAGWFRELPWCRELLPAGDRIVAVVDAVCAYLHISDAATDYVVRCTRVLELLGSIAEGDLPECPALAEDLVREFIMEASAHYLAAHAVVRSQFRARLHDWGLMPPLAAVGWAEIDDLLGQPLDRLPPLRERVRSAIVDGMFREAERLGGGPFSAEEEDAPISVCAEGPAKWDGLPEFLDDELEAMGAAFSPTGAEAGDNVGNDEARNRIYLGTYFPRSVVESRNIVGEIMSIPVVRKRFGQKGRVRILDLGAGTGGATIGAALALFDAGITCPVDIVAVDGNRDALGKMERLVAVAAGALDADVRIESRFLELQADLDGYAGRLREFIATCGDHFDIVLCWKVLSEFYDRSWVRAGGIIGRTLGAMATRVCPDGFLIVTDITTKNRRPEFFSQTLNRESRTYELSGDSMMCTIVPVPCAKFRDDCGCGNCFTLRKMSVCHRLAPHDSTKIAYRVLVPMALGSRVVGTFSPGDVYNVNSNKTKTGCARGYVQDAPSPRCGWTGF
jgi:SAM-dependent methyltransferase